MQCNPLIPCVYIYIYMCVCMCVYIYICIEYIIQLGRVRAWNRVDLRPGGIITSTIVIIISSSSSSSSISVSILLLYCFVCFLFLLAAPSLSGRLRAICIAAA